MIHDSLENAGIYFTNHDWWTEAIDFIKALDKDCPCGKVELSNGMFVSIEQYSSKQRENAHFESHRKMIDIQATITGVESIEVQPVSDLEVVEEYDEKRDVAFYERSSRKGIVHNLPGYFTVLFPQDAHMPGLRVDDQIEVKKLVVKVPLELATP